MFTMLSADNSVSRPEAMHEAIFLGLIPHHRKKIRKVNAPFEGILVG